MKFVIIGLLITVIVIPTDVSSCACCANPGTWSEIRYDIRSGEAQSDQFTQQMQTFELIGDVFSMEHYKGSQIFTRGYKARVTYKDMEWNFNIRDPKSGSYHPSFRFVLSPEYREFKVDQGTSGNSAEIILYKEFRFSGKVYSISTDLPIHDGTEAFLVLQGRGNNCFNTDDLNHWIFHFQLQDGDITEWAGADGTMRLNLSADLPSN